MQKIAYIFPGQGAQYVGMGEDFYQQYPRAREIFDLADELLGFELSKLMFSGPSEELTRTANCQVAIFTASIASLKVLQAECPKLRAKMTAGLSLGEYTALVAGGALSFQDGLNLVKVRGEFMEEASAQKPGGMVSVIGMPLEEVERIAVEAKVEVANLNCPGQVVISGAQPALELAKERAHQGGARKTISLHVGGAFHSSLMESARVEMVKALENTQIKMPEVPVVSNVSAKEVASVDEIKANLAMQVVSRTLWEKSIERISSLGIKDFVEIGPGRVLKGLMRKINHELKVWNIETVADLKSFKEEHRT